MIDISFLSIIDGSQGVVIGVVALLLLIAYKRLLIGIFDPWFPLIVNQSIFLLLLSLLFLQGEIDGGDYVYWIASTFFFFLPLFLLSRKRKLLRATKPIEATTPPSSIYFLIIAICSYQLLLDALFVWKRGFPVFYEYGSNPLVYGGGFGAVKYVHDAVKVILPPLAVYATTFTKRRASLILSIVTVVYPSLLFEWSKAGLFSVFASFWFSGIIFFGYRRVFKRLALSGFLLALAFALFMFSRTARTGYGLNAIDAFGIRLVQTIDSPYLYFVQQGKSHIAEDLSFPRYLLLLVSPFAGIDLSANSVANALLEAVGIPTEAGYGPSPPFQVVGHVFWGVFGIAYAAAIGILLSVNSRRLSSADGGRRMLYVMLYGISGVLAGDISLFPYYCATTAFLAPPLLVWWLIVSLTKSPSDTILINDSRLNSATLQSVQ